MGVEKLYSDYVELGSELLNTDWKTAILGEIIELGVDVRDMIVAKLLSETFFIGFIGKLLFYTFRSQGNFYSIGGKGVPLIKTNTFNSLERKYTANFADHNVISGKPVTEFTGASLNEMSLDIVFHQTLGTDPLRQVRLLQRMIESGEPQLVFLDYKYEGKWTIRGVNATEKHWHDGRPAIIACNIDLKEYRSGVNVSGGEEADESEREVEEVTEAPEVTQPEELAGNNPQPDPELEGE